MRRAALILALAGCAPELDDTTAIVTAPRLLAARVEPPEVAPGAAITTTALWADPDGTLVDAPLDWAFCTARKRFGEPGPVAGACLVAESPDLVPFGAGLEASGLVPAEACREFGPDTPAPVPGEPAGRPADPDGTGGFYQPIRIFVREPDETFVLGEARIRCGLPSATPAQALEFRETYVPNANPAIEEVALDGTAIDDAGAPRVPTSAEVELGARWATCDEAPCSGAEPYVWFDPAARLLATRREAMRVSWFATAGAFATGHTGRDEGDGVPSTSNTWRAPAEAGSVRLWVVLRDDRGGASWATFRVEVE